MCVKILEVAGRLDMNEYNFFLRGGLVRKHDMIDPEIHSTAYLNAKSVSII